VWSFTSCTRAGLSGSHARRPRLLSRLKLLAWATLFQTALSLFFASQIYLLAPKISFRTAFAFSAPRWYVWGLLVPAICRLDRKLSSRTLSERVALHVPLGVAWTLLAITIRLVSRPLRVSPWPPSVTTFFVNDLKLEPREGGVALWVGPGTEGYFSDLKITPKTAVSRGDAAAIIGFVKNGGSLLLVLDEEQRQSLAKTGVNDLIVPFGMKLSGDTPHIPNTGAIAKAGEINREDREIPYDRGREVFGGTPFAYQLDRKGHLAQPYGGSAKFDNGARVVVLAEGMASRP
jgi:hypothetical protein